MKEKNNLDQWLRNRLDSYSPAPSGSAKNRFLAEAGSTKSPGSSGALLFTSILAALILSSVVLYELNSEHGTSLKYYPPSMKLTSVNEPEKISGDLSTTTSQFYSAKEKELSDVKESRSVIINNQMISEGEQYPHNQDNNIRSQKDVPEVKPLQSFSDAEGIGIVMDPFDENIALSDINLKLIPVPSGITSTTGVSSNPSDKSGKIKSQEKLYNTMLFLYYRPEYLWNIIETEKYVHNLGLEWQTRLFNGRYVLGTGLGLSLNKGYYEYGINYNEYLGNYQRLDSVTFDWNPEDFVMQYDVHTTEEPVFDTAVKTSYERVYRKFVYLQLPLTLGYDFMNTEKTTIGFRFVPVISLLLSKKPVDFRYDGGNNKIIQINRITADRVNSNWQLNTGLVYGRRLNETLRLEIEPRFTYYFNSVFEKSDNSVPPMGASIRVALGIRY